MLCCLLHGQGPSLSLLSMSQNVKLLHMARSCPKSSPQALWLETTPIFPQYRRPEAR